MTIDPVIAEGVACSTDEQTRLSNIQAEIPGLFSFHFAGNKGKVSTFLDFVVLVRKHENDVSRFVTRCFLMRGFPFFGGTRLLTLSFKTSHT